MSKNLLPQLAPMLAKPSSQLPADTADFATEIKWDGIRAMIYIENRRLHILSRNGFDITFRYPEIQPLSQTAGRQNLILDGEIVALDTNNLPSFSLLQQRMNLDDLKRISEITERVPVNYIIFDLLYYDSQLILNTKYRERRQKLAQLALTGATWSTPDFKTGQTAEILEVSRKLGLEGIILKRLDSLYLPGKRSSDWLKIKNIRRQEFIIAGWTPGEGLRAQTIGAVILAYYDLVPEEAAKRGVSPQLLYAGSCGTGFTKKGLQQLEETLRALYTPDNPFSQPVKKSGVSFCRPTLVGEFSFTEWTATNTLRHPSFQGWRMDKDPHHVIRENMS